jgi:hypothetical protein
MWRFESTAQSMPLCARPSAADAAVVLVSTVLIMKYDPSA